MTMQPVGRKVSIEVVDVLEGGTCPHGLAPGRRWMVDSGVVPEGMCGSGYHAIFPYLTTLRFGGDLPWESEHGVSRIACPDPENPVVFEMRVQED